MIWEQLGWELARVALSVILTSIIVLFTLGEMIKKQGPEFAKQLLKMDTKQLEQLHSAEARVSKSASQMVAKDLMTVTPLAELVQYLSEDTRLYLQSHPEALPGILQNYAGTIDLALTLAPRIQAVLGLAKTEKTAFDL